MIIDEEDYDNVLVHYGTPRHSGRYPWGSGGNAMQDNRSFLDKVDQLKREGHSEADIAKGFGTKTSRIRDLRSVQNAREKLERINTAEKLKAKGMSLNAIAKQMGLPGDSSVRALLAPSAKERAQVITATSDMLRREVQDKKFIDVGAGIESHLSISKEKLRSAVSVLESEGYPVHGVKVKAVATGKDIDHKVLGLPGSTQKEVWQNPSLIKLPMAVSDDGGQTWSGKKKHPIVSIDPSRVAVRYGPEGGLAADGVIFVRPGVEDLSLGKNHYAQVRIKVGDSHYLKGMARYKDDLPDGTDLIFNTNKSREDALKKGDVKLGAMKELEPHPDYPFGSVVRQLIVNPGADDEHVKSAMNIVNEEGSWDKWDRNLSAQALSKQVPSLAKQQLQKTYDSRKEEFDNLLALTNPAVKKKLLQTFADATDNSAVHLKAAALDRQNWHVILPIDNIKPDEIYAPKYNNGETVALIRYPHGGTFEIPELRVNNRNREAKAALGDNPIDAVGIHHSVAERLSGADFDGDTVLVIPNNDRKIRVDPALEGLKGFDAKTQFKLPDGVKFEDTGGKKQRLMGDVSNLITDMTILGAPHSEIVRAVKHSMVVIDAEKHDLDWRRSAEAFGIKALKQQYQGAGNAGASTLISRATSRTDVLDRKDRPHGLGGPVDEVTGEKRYVLTGKMTTTKSGKVVPKKIQSKKLAEVSNAHDLVSKAGTPVEKIYADHSNRLKDLANQARLAKINTPNLEYSESAKNAYSKEVASLNAKLVIAKKNAPIERQAQRFANETYAAKKAANPGLKKETLKKIKFQAQEEARARFGVERKSIKITQEEWNAIQAGAIRHSRLSDILDHSDLDIVRKLATPRPEHVMTETKKVRARQMLANGNTLAEVARLLGVSVSTLNLAVSGDSTEGD